MSDKRQIECDSIDEVKLIEARMPCFVASNEPSNKRDQIFNLVAE
jgi:hypothetical protein